MTLNHGTRLGIVLIAFLLLSSSLISFPAVAGFGSLPKISPAVASETPSLAPTSSDGTSAQNIHVGILGSMLSYYAPATVSNGSAMIWTNQTSYPPESNVTIYGSGFVRSTAINLTVTEPNSTLYNWTTISDVNGNFTTYYLLDALTGNYTVVATDGIDTATAWFVDPPNLGLTPSQGPTGTTTTLDGTSYSHSVTYNYCFESRTPVISATACSSTYQFTTTSNGAIPSGVTLQISGSTGSVVVSHGTTVDKATLFTITIPTLSILPISGPINTITILSGTLYAPGGTYSYCFESGVTTPVSCSGGSPTFTTASSGSKAGNIPAGTTLTITFGSSTGLVVVSQGIIVEASQTFTVTTASLSLTPNSGPSGTTTTLSGSSYAPSYTYDYCFDSGAISPPSTFACPPSSPSFTTDLSGNIPSGGSLSISGSTGYVLVVDPTSNAVVRSAQFTVTSPTLILTPNSGPSGTTATLSGSGYAPSYVYSYCFESGVTSSPTSCAATHQFITDSSGNIPSSVTLLISGSTGLVVVSDPNPAHTIVMSALFTVRTIVTQPVTITTANSATSATITVSGCNVSPTSITADGSSVSLTADPSCTLTFTVPTDGANSRYRFSNSGTASATWTVATCASGTCTSATNTVYYQLQNTFSVTMVGGNPPIGDAVVLTGTYLGSAANMLTLDVGGSSSASSTAWSDYNTAVTFRATTTMSGSSERWAINGATSTPALTAGGGSYSQTYYHQYKITFQYNISNTPQGSPSSGPTVTFNQFGSSKSSDTADLAPSLSSYDWIDASSSTSAITYSNPFGATSTEQWAADSTPSFAASSSTTLNPKYYHQFLISWTFTTQDGSTITPAPSLSGTAFGNPTTDATGQIWLDAGTTASLPSPIPALPTDERWTVSSGEVVTPPYTDVRSITVSSTTASNSKIAGSASLQPEYYHQFLQTLSYSVIDGGSPSAPSASGLQFGSSYAPTLTNSATGYWFDSTGSISFTNPITGGAGEQWTATPTSIPATQFNTQVVDYYHQYLVTFDYSIVGGAGTSSPPTVTFSSLGVPTTCTATCTQQYVDADSYSYTNPLVGSGSSERWQANSGDTGTVSASGTISPTYYHQFDITFQYSISDSSAPGAPTVYYTQFGSSTTNTPAQAPATSSSDWVDAGTAILYTNPLSASGPTQRWQTNLAIASGKSTIDSSVSSSETLNPTFWHQFYMTFEYHTSDGSFTSDPNVAYYEFGGSLSVAATTSGASVWADAGSTYTYDNPTSSSGASERWMASSTPTGTISSSTTVDPEYFHQFLISFQYTVSNALTGTPSTDPTVSYKQFGGGFTALAALSSPPSDWADAGTSVTYTNPINGASGERWKISPESSASPYVADSSVASSTTLNPTYFHQFDVTFAYTTSDATTINSYVNLISYAKFGGTLHLSTDGSGVLSLSNDWADAGTSVTYTSPASISSSERYQIASGDLGTNIVISSVGGSSKTADSQYYHQFLQMLSYLVIDGGSPSPPSANGLQFGSPYAPALTNIATGYWFDSVGSISFTNPITGGAGERWAASPTSISATLSNTQIVDYYHQYLVTFDYSIVGGSGTSSPPTVTFKSLGVSTMCTATCSQQYVDASSYSYTNPLVGSGPSERWQANAGAAGAVTSSGTISPTYYHQFLVYFQYTVVDGGSPTAPTASYTSFGGAASKTAALSLPPSDWVDYGSSVSYTNPLGGSTSTERWQTDLPISSGASTVDISVSVTETLNPSYYYQFEVSFAYTTNDGTTINSYTNLVEYAQFGNTLHLSTSIIGALSSSSDWADATTAVTYISPVTISSSERYQISSGDLGSSTIISSVSGLHNNADPEYYHQFDVTFGYTTSDTSKLISQSNLVSYAQFGFTLHLSTDASGVLSLSNDWADAGTSITYVSPVTITSNVERYQISSTDSGTNTAITSVSATDHAADPEYFHQFAYTLSYAIVGGGSPTAPTLSSTQYGSSYSPTIATTATVYWLDNGASWSMTNPLTPLTSTERWITNSTTSGTVSSASSTSVFTYNHQFWLSASTYPSVVPISSITESAPGVNCATTSSTYSCWYNSGNKITLIAYPFSGYTFSAWTLTGVQQTIGADHLTVTMSATQTAVAIYVQFTINSASIVDGDTFSPLSSFQVVFNKCTTSGGCTFAATNPGTFFYQLQFTNNGPASSIAVSITIPSDFGLQSNAPCQVNGVPVACSIGSIGSGQGVSLSLGSIANGQHVTILIHLVDILKGKTGYPYTSPTTYLQQYDFPTTIIVGSIPVNAPAPHIVGTGKQATAIGGFILDTNGAPKSGDTVTIYNSQNVVVGVCEVGNNAGQQGPCVVGADGFYFISVSAGGPYKVVVTNSVNMPAAGGTKNNIQVSQYTYVEVDFALSPSDPAIQGFVLDTLGNPVSGATVQLIDSRGHVIASELTSNGGFYAFRFTIPGQYTVRVLLPSGYSASTTSVTLSLKQGQSVNVNFILTKQS